MCGLTGFIDYKFSSNRELLTRMNDTLQHRGPDNAGSLILNEKECQIGLGHRRLSIIDLSAAGNQPMADECKNYFIVFNGEIYNYKEIKKELESLGITFFSYSDTEVILKSYIQWGMKAVDKFIGMFAFALYDKVEHKIIFCRDRAGVKPFYYYLSKNLILFGSELKSLMAHPDFKKKIDSNALGSFFKHGWIGAPSSIFESTFKVKAGFYIEINLRTKETKEICYWDAYNYYNAEPLNISFQESKEKLHELLKSACEYRMVADTEVGVFLSGGFDSSLVTAILQSGRQKKINSFSIGFEEEEFNEAPFAMRVANHLGTNHHEIVCTAKDALDIIPSLPFYYDEPFADSSAIPTMLVSRLAGKYVKVALSADGGDEVFGGYPKYYIRMDYLNKLRAIPHFLKKPLAQLLWFPEKLSISRNPHIQILLEKFKNYLLHENRQEIFRQRSEPYHFSSKEIRNLLKDGSHPFISSTFYDDFNLRETLDPSMLMMAIDYKTILTDDMLVKVDRATMAYSLEGREPLLDHRLLEFTARLESNHHFRNRKTKALIREIAYEYIPPALLDRPKKGFSIPTNKWLHNELKDLIIEVSSKSFLVSQNIFDFKSCDDMIKNYYRGFDKNGERIWFFLMFQLWYKKWISPR